MNTAVFPSPALLERGTTVRGALRGVLAPGLSDEGQAVFLHTGWRSGGTWVWSRCREVPRVHGYYEPLHEHAARLSRRDVARMRPGSWKSNHSETAPYFEEYTDLIPVRGRGVSLYQKRFAFDDFFRAPNDPGDAALEGYIASLLAPPIAEGRLPVLKFCRSMGRVGWFEQLFPQALHAVVLREPIAQFRSGERLLREQRNRYFVLAPLLVLTRNVGNPTVREATTALGVSLPTLYSDDMDYGVEACWAHVRRASAAERYRCFLTFWTLCAISALESEAFVIDIDAMVDDLDHRRGVELALQARIGEPIELAPRASHVSDAETRPPGWREAHDAAAAFVRACGARLAPARMDIILEKLGGDDAVLRPAPSWQIPQIPAHDRSPVLSRRVTTWAEVQLARAMQPLRRLHGSLAARDTTRK